MKNDLIVKDNILINASYNLELTEQRLVLLAIINARESGKGINANDPLTIHAESYINQFNVSRQTAYQTLKVACKDLFSRQFSYTENYANTNKIKKVNSRWVSKIAYVDDLAILEITFSPDVVPFITRLEKHFTSYQLKQVQRLTSKYSMRLYELLIAWSAVKKCTFQIETFRNSLGISSDEYKQMGHFKNRVLDPAIKQINEHTDINVSYEQHKQGRVITGFSFKFDYKKTPKKEIKDVKRNKDTIDMFFNMTDPQVAMYSSKLCRLPEFSYLATGNEGYEVLASKIAKMLKDEKQQKIFADALQIMGFKTKK